MKKYFLLLFTLCIPILCNAQIFSDEKWEEKMMVTGKWSQLYYELNVGFDLTEDYSADFLYVSMGYGKPTTKNAWRKFLPNSEQAAPDSKDEMLNRTDDNTNGLHAGTVGLGWQHFFNHVIGFHVQAGWGFIANFGTNSSSSLSTDDDAPKTYIYNTVPVQAGVDINLWNNLNLQAGATYMWKEIPIITIGIGVVF